jgi:hypothetical protein
VWAGHLSNLDWCGPDIPVRQMSVSSSDFGSPRKRGAFSVVFLDRNVRSTRLHKNLIEQLLYGAAGFKNRVAMVHDAGEVSVGESNATEWASP